MQCGYAMSERVYQRDSKRLAFADMADGVPFPEEMYDCFSDGDTKEGCIKYKAALVTQMKTIE